MIRKSQRRQVVDYVDDILCDKCGKSLKVEDSGHVEFYGLVDQHYYTGYCSPALTDGVRYDFDVCEKCLAEWFDTFKRHPRETEDMGMFGPPPSSLK